MNDQPQHQRRSALRRDSRRRAQSDPRLASRVEVPLTLRLSMRDEARTEVRNDWRFGRMVWRLCVISGVLLISATRTLAALQPSGAATAKTTARVRSTVLLRAPSVATAAKVEPATRPAAALPPAAAPAVETTPRSTLAFMRAARSIEKTTADASVAAVIPKPSPGRPPIPPTLPTIAMPDTAEQTRRDAQTDPQTAAATLATALYGSHAKLKTLTLLTPTMATVWVNDTATKEKAPPGLGVGEGVALPFRYISVDSVSGAVMALKPWFDDGGGLRYDSRIGAYVARLRIGLRDTIKNSVRRALDPKIRLSIAASADSITPTRLEISETNVFDTQARLVTSRIGPALRVTVWPDFAPDGVELWIPFLPDSVLVDVDHPSIAGLGLEEATVMIRLSAGSVAPNDSLAVQLKVSNGTFREGPVVYAKGAGVARVHLRSSGIGAQTITADAGSFISGSHPIDFSMPIGLLLGGLMGALVGSMLGLLRERQRSRRRSYVAFLLSGLLTGELLAIIAAIGVLKLPGLDLASGGAALVSFVAGAIGGYVGPRGLEKLIPAFAAGRDDPPSPTPAKAG